jgi:hypothetical protein
MIYLVNITKINANPTSLDAVGPIQDVLFQSLAHSTTECLVLHAQYKFMPGMPEFLIERSQNISGTI